MFQRVRRKSRAIVRDPQNRLMVLLFESDVDPAAAGRVLDRILSEVEDEPKEQRVITHDPQAWSRGDRAYVAGPCGQLTQGRSGVRPTPRLGASLMKHRKMSRSATAQSF
jgi:hypothetical protein